MLPSINIGRPSALAWCHPLAGHPRLSKKASGAGNSWEACQQTAHYSCPSYPVSTFLPWVSAETSRDDGLQDIRWNKRFPPRLCALVFYHSHRNPNWDLNIHTNMYAYTHTFMFTCLCMYILTHTSHTHACRAHSHPRTCAYSHSHN